MVFMKSAINPNNGKEIILWYVDHARQAHYEVWYGRGGAILSTTSKAEANHEYNLALR